MSKQRVFHFIGHAKKLNGTFTARNFLSLSLLSLLASCSFELELPSASSIQGKVVPLVSSSSLSLSKSSENLLCSSAVVKLYSVDQNGFQVEPELASTNLESDGSYSFVGLRDLGVETLTASSTNSYLVSSEGCGEVYSRILTNTTQQDITYGSSVLAFALASDNGDKVKDAVINSNGEKLEELTQILQGQSSFADAYSVLNSNTQASTLFDELFGTSDKSFLQGAAPYIILSSVPKNLDESQTYTFSVDADHWNPSYSIAYDWNIDGAQVSTSNSHVFSTSADSQKQNVLLTLKVGADDGFGQVDLSKPYRVRYRYFNIRNNLPATVPPVVLASSSVTPNTTVTLQMSTGAGQSLCESFSRLAITENQTGKPATSVFDAQSLTCTTAVTQNISYNLVDTNDGTKRLRVWAQDSSGNISDSPQLVVMTLDSTAPVLAYSSPAASSYHQGSVTITGTCDPNFSVSISGTGVASASSISCASGSFSQNVSFSAGEGVKTIALSQTDLAANTTSVSRDFIKDTLAPVVVIASPSTNSSSQAGIILAGSCEDGLPVQISGTGIPGPVTATCSSSSFSQALTFTAAEGAKAIQVLQTDLSGNPSNNATRTFIKDSVKPLLTSTSPANGSGHLASVVLAGACESGLNIDYAGAGLLAPLSVACSAGSYSQTVFFSAGDGAKIITISQTDAAGNTETLTKNLVRDETDPIITQTTLTSPHLTATNSVTFGGACETGLSVSVDLSGTGPEGTTSCIASSWSYTVATQATDALRTYSFSQTDSAGNSSTVSAQWERDTVDPVLTITSSASVTSGANSVTFSGACETGLGNVSVSNTETASVACSSGTWSFTSSTITSDGSYDYDFSLTDAAGNSTTVTGAWTRDTSGPAFTVASGLNITNNLDSFVISGLCEDALSVDITGEDTNTASCSGGSWSYTVATKTSDASRTYTISQTDLASNTTSETVTWLRDTTAPVFQSGTFVVNSGVSPTSVRVVPVDFDIVDASSNVQDICIKITSSAPGPSDSCWQTLASLSVMPAPSLSVNGLNISLGLADLTYTVYGWARDSLGNISVMTNAGIGTLGQDMQQVALSVGTPPVLSSIIAANTDSPTEPATASELSVNAGQDVFIKWNATDDFALPAQSIDLYFTQDDVNFTKINVGAALPNSQGTGCTVTGSFTGCYRWTSPLGTVFKVRVIVTDSNGQSVSATSATFNTNGLNIIAGNTDTGLGASAKSALFFPAVISNPRFADTGSFVVTDSGDIYFRDVQRGILKVEAATGVVDLFIPTTGTSSGDNGPVTSATLNNPNRMNLTPDNKIVVFDHDRIREIDLNVNPATIRTIVGGGSDNTDSVTDPLQLQFAQVSHGINDNDFRDERLSRGMNVSPSGDIYFKSDDIDPDSNQLVSQVNKNRLRVYRKATNTIETIRLTGTGTPSHPSLDISTCAISHLGLEFDPAGVVTTAIAIYTGNGGIHSSGAYCEHNPIKDTSTVTDVAFDPSSFQTQPSVDPASVQYDWTLMKRNGLDGKIYGVDRERGYIARYNSSTLLWEIIAGVQGSPGFCADGVLATSCNMQPYDVFVSKTSKVYFVDRGVIRQILNDGTVATLAGQSGVYGDGGPSIEARMSWVTSIGYHQNGGDYITFYDGLAGRIREFEVRGTINTIAGDGTNGDAVTGVAATSSPLRTIGNNDWSITVTDQSTGDIYATFSGNDLGKLNRSTGEWEAFWGTGSTWYDVGDGSTGTSINIDYGTTNVKFMAISPTQTLSSFLRYNSSTNKTYNRQLKALDLSTRLQSHVAGIAEDPATSSTCADGSLAATCAINWSINDVTGGAWDATNSRWLIPHRGPNNIYIFEPGGNKNTLVSGLPNGLRGFAYDEINDRVYYCGTDGQIHRQDVGGSNSSLAWPIPNMSCTGTNLIYDAGNNRLFFSFLQNGLYGVAEYILP